MNSSILLLALTAGMVGAINPCGFSLLPAYIGSFVAGDDVESPLDRRLLRAVWSAVSVTAGFVLVFVILAALWPACLELQRCMICMSGRLRRNVWRSRRMSGYIVSLTGRKFWLR